MLFRSVSRQVLIFRPQRIRGPGSDAGKTVERESCRHVVFTRAVSIRFAFDGVQKAHVVGHVTEMRHKVRDHLAAFTARPKVPRALRQIPLFALKRHELLPAGHRLPVSVPKLRFVIERIQLTARTRAEDHKDSFRCGREVSGT